MAAIPGELELTDEKALQQRQSAILFALRPAPHVRFSSPRGWRMDNGRYTAP
jgi:hypothetical protein